SEIDQQYAEVIKSLTTQRKLESGLSSPKTNSSILRYSSNSSHDRSQSRPLAKLSLAPVARISPSSPSSSTSS
ncbi:hypothetical protein PFISCL1PPCAC_24171, partial [Pristionchus fissidentatus]